MKIIIIGIGSIGHHVAEILSKEGHELTVIDNNAENVKVAQDSLDALVIHGDGVDFDVLKSAGIEDIDGFIAVTDKDDINILSCLIAKSFNVKVKIARINDINYNNALCKIGSTSLGIDYLINPNDTVASEICNMVSYVYASEAAVFAEGSIVHLGFKIDELSPIVGQTIKELVSGDVRFVLTKIVHKEKVYIPSMEKIISAGDTISFICKKKDLGKIRKLLGLKTNDVKQIFILGAGAVGIDVAKRLQETKHFVKLIDKDQKKCMEVSENLDGVMVICADNTDIEALREENISDSDAFISSTGDDQINILGSLLAQKAGAKKTITVIDKAELVGLSSSLGMDICISPRLIVASKILNYLRGDLVWSVASLDNENSEVIEFQIPASSLIVNIPIMELDVPEGVKIGAIFRGDEAILPLGKDMFEEDDHVIVFSLADSVLKAEKFFS